MERTAADNDLRGLQEIGFAHMRILEGVSTVVQLGELCPNLFRTDADTIQHPGPQAVYSQDCAGYP